jgi:catechol 2,3-dioxygenase-like lactoylglutathione lyase family enzyme
VAVELNHTIVHVSDRKAAAEWVSAMLGLGPPKPWGPFYGVDLANGVQLDFADYEGEPHPMHFAFLISEQEFDEIYGRIKEQNVAHWADPMASRPNEINHNDGGRGVYFQGPDGHFLEVITRPYGSGG